MVAQNTIGIEIGSNNFRRAKDSVVIIGVGIDSNSTFGIALVIHGILALIMRAFSFLSLSKCFHRQEDIRQSFSCWFVQSNYCWDLQ